MHACMPLCEYVPCPTGGAVVCVCILVTEFVCVWVFPVCTYELLCMYVSRRTYEYACACVCVCTCVCEASSSSSWTGNLLRPQIASIQCEESSGQCQLVLLRQLNFEGMPISSCLPCSQPPLHPSADLMLQPPPSKHYIH